MRRFVLAAAVVTLACASDFAAAEPLVRQTKLRARPDAHARVVAMLAPGLDVNVESAGRRGWVLVSLGEVQGYAQASAFSRPSPLEAEAAAAAASCDLGYPYSGSARYFTGLTELRTSEPLSFFFGRHIARPC